MFDLKELKLMFLDPTDLIINNINKFLYSNKQLNLFFLRNNFPIFSFASTLFSSYFFIF